MSSSTAKRSIKMVEVKETKAVCNCKDQLELLRGEYAVLDKKLSDVLDEVRMITLWDLVKRMFRRSA